MKGFYWGKGVVRCSFCRNKGHNITSCPLVEKYADLAMQKITANPNHILSGHEHTALIELKKREERKLKLKKPKSPPKCSFCRSTDHKRPKCDVLSDFKLDTYQANKNWKRVLKQRVNDAGMGIGSLIQIDPRLLESTMVADIADRYAMITNIDLSNLNMFCGLSEGSYKYHSNSIIEIMIGTRVEQISIKYFSGILGRDLLAPGWWYDSHGVHKVINKMPWEPDTNLNGS